MINEYNVHIADACYHIAAHALPDAHCVIAFWRITFMLRKVLISVSEWPWQRDPFTVGENFHGETPSHKTYTCQQVALAKGTELLQANFVLLRPNESQTDVDDKATLNPQHLETM